VGRIIRRIVWRILALIGVLSLYGCALGPVGGVPWEAGIPDYSTPTEPTKAPAVAGSCLAVSAVSEPCVGLVIPPSEVQFLYDTEAQAVPLRDLLGFCAQGRAADRLWADQHYAKIIVERDKARRQRWETLAIGGAVGAGLAAGIFTAIAIGTR
jgi:hypothetical protein